MLGQRERNENGANTYLISVKACCYTYISHQDEFVHGIRFKMKFIYID